MTETLWMPKSTGGYHTGIILVRRNKDPWPTRFIQMKYSVHYWLPAHIYTGYNVCRWNIKQQTLNIGTIYTWIMENWNITVVSHLSPMFYKECTLGGARRLQVSKSPANQNNVTNTKNMSKYTHTTNTCCRALSCLGHCKIKLHCHKNAVHIVTHITMLCYAKTSLDLIVTLTVEVLNHIYKLLVMNIM